MLPIVSQPYRVPADQRLKVSTALARGIAPQALNLVVMLAVFVALLWASLHAMPLLLTWTERQFGGGEGLFIALAVLTFAVPWLVVFLAWRRIWIGTVRRRMNAMVPEPGDLVVQIDEAGLRVDEADLCSNSMSWGAVTRLLLVGDTLVVSRGAFGLMVSLAAIGGRPALAAIAAHLTPTALAASDPEIRRALAPSS